MTEKGSPDLRSLARDLHPKRRLSCRCRSAIRRQRARCKFGTWFALNVFEIRQQLQTFHFSRRAVRLPTTWLGSGQFALEAPSLRAKTPRCLGVSWNNLCQIGSLIRRQIGRHRVAPQRDLNISSIAAARVSSR